jgi:ABC-2 type transport system ATP-binding protein
MSHKNLMESKPLHMLSIKNISKHYGPHQALRDVTLHIEAGEFCALLGPNGAGKSTLFQILCGLFSPSQGSVEIDGIDLSANPSKALAKIGVVFQQQSLDPDLSVVRNLQFHADLHGLRPALAQERIDEGLQSLGLTNEKNRLIRELSGGTRRKVELTRALLHRPRILLMDEATVGLDPKSRRDLLQTVWEQVKLHACSVLWATHWVEEAVQADRVVALHRGQIIADGTPASVAAQWGHASLEQGFIEKTSAAPASGA